jgi:magnesium-transporting ATPase (P-type)
MSTSFQAFKFIELYALIQFFTVCLLVSMGANMTDFQFLYIDLLALIPLAILQSRTGAYPTLNEKLPTATLFYAPVLASVIGSAMIQLGFQLVYFYTIKAQPFYVPKFEVAPTIAGSKIYSYEDTVLFLVSNFQYLTVAIAFSTAYPFRKPIYSNLPFFLSACFLLLGDIALVLMPNPGFSFTYGENNMPVAINLGRNPVANFFFLYPFTNLAMNSMMQSFYYYRYIILLGVICNCIATLGYEKYFISWYTDSCDKKEKLKKDKEFESRMVKPIA